MTYCSIANPLYCHFAFTSVFNGTLFDERNPVIPAGTAGRSQDRLVRTGSDDSADGTGYTNPAAVHSPAERDWLADMHCKNAGENRQTVRSWQGLPHDAPHIPQGQ